MFQVRIKRCQNRGRNLGFSGGECFFIVLEVVFLLIKKCWFLVQRKEFVLILRVVRRGRNFSLVDDKIEFVFFLLIIEVFFFFLLKNEDWKVKRSLGFEFEQRFLGFQEGSGDCGIFVIVGFSCWILFNFFLCGFRCWFFL